MPDGKNHNIINITVLVIIISGLYSLSTRADIVLPMEYLNFQTISVFSISYLFGTFFLSPDLDINSSPYGRWGDIQVPVVALQGYVQAQGTVAPFYFRTFDDPCLFYTYTDTSPGIDWI